MAARATPGQFSFNAGELSPRMHGRVDQNVYPIGLKEMLGYVPTVQGPAVAMPGTHYVEQAAGPCRVIPFEYVVTQGYVIEASALAFRYYTNDARIETAPGVPYATVHSYSYDQLLDLDWQQSADVLYLAGGGRQQALLTRTGAETFTFAVEALRNGPIGDGNSDEAITVTASATTGSVTLTASAGIFEAGHVGAFFELEASDFNDIKSWEPGMKGITVNTTKVTWAGKVYIARAAADVGNPQTGSVPPIHDKGSEWDGQGGEDSNGKGPYGVKWEYLHGRYGLLTITAFTNSTHVTATVINRLADSLTGTASWRWAFGAFSDAAGWPDTVALWDESRVFTMNNSAYTSGIGDLDNFEKRDSSGDFQRDLAGQFTIPDPARIVWSKADRLLLLGTEKGEYAVERLQIQNGTPGPPVFAVKQQTGHGSRRTRPLTVDGRMVFIQRAGRKVRLMDYQLSSDRYTAPDLTRLADHIGLAGFTEAAWQAEPERLAWYVMGDGSLAVLTLDPDQQVMGWARRTLGGGLMARSICAITDPSGARDQLWLAAETQGGDWWILRMHKLWETGDAAEDAIFLDAALSYDGAPADEISGLDHLEGQSVSILADGKVHPDRTVSGGAVTLAWEASKVHVGLAFPARMTTLEPETGSGEGTGQGKKKRVTGITLRVVETLGIGLEVQGCGMEPVETRAPDAAMDAATALYSGDIGPIATIGDYDGAASITISREQPLPSTIVAVLPELEVGDSR